jgi:3-oxoacyl-[acyl-carrier protein] reductase
MSAPPSSASGAKTLEGQVAVVTGSTRGIGRAIAVELGKAGASVVLHGRRTDWSGGGFREESSLSANQVRYVAADLADPSQPERLVAEAWQAFGRVDVWVNNAGADVLTGEASRWTFERKLEELWKVDVLGAVNLSRLVGQRMVAAGRGAIVSIGWDQAEQGMAGDSGEMFSTIKGAVMAFTRSLAQSLAPHVRVNCVAPGWIRTAWGEEASDYWQRRATQESLRERWGTPEDVAQAVLFLASPAADFITGQIVRVNGGFRYGAAEPKT